MVKFRIISTLREGEDTILASGGECSLLQEGEDTILASGGECFLC